MKKIDISVLIPTRNEEANIENLLTEILFQLKQYTTEIIVVDDSSEDHTRHIVMDMARSNPLIHLIKRTGNPDLGKSILKAIRAAKGEIIVGMDADFNHHPRYLVEIIAHSKKKQIVVGSRFAHGGGMQEIYRQIFTYLFNFVLKHVLSFPILDNTSGYYCIQKNDLLKLPLNNIFYGYGEYFLRLIWYASSVGYNIHEIPVYYQKRSGGKSKSKLFTMLLIYTTVALRLRFYFSRRNSSA